MSKTLKTPALWLALVAISLACALGAARLFPLSFPLVSVDISMDRPMALQQADQLAERFGWGPENFRSAASYNHDAEVQHFVELTAGGAEAYRELLADDLYSPYTWVVRLFREGEAEQTWVRFTPGGDPYGFSVGLPENAPGEALMAEEARSLAETAARELWHIDLQSFERLEASENLNSGGRLDHSFTYRRHDATLGDGEYRLRLRVSGDQFTELSHFVHIPQSFQRQYAELRSSNNTLATVALIAMAALFFFGGCVVGLFFMIRQGYLVWRTPVLWGSGIGLLVALTQLNAIPLSWMSYDNATSAQNHLLTQIITAVGVFVIVSGLFSLIFMAAESMSRRAFPHHIQLWRTWHREVAPTRQVLTMTGLGLLLVAPFLLYSTTGYWFTTETLGWWVPSEQLFHPDVLAQYQPWLPAIAGPLQAAFWEEAMFRAIPIAGAVLLGQRFGGTRYWLVAAVILQTVIFAAAHANYPQQPYYARTLELILPSLLFAGLYIRFGLYPAILLHFWYNAVWFALPIFSASAPGIWVDQALIILLALTPFWILIFQWLRQGRALNEAPAQARNAHWQPAVKPESSAAATDTRNFDPSNAAPAEPQGVSASPWVFRSVLLAALVGLVLWATLGRFDTQAPAVEIDRAQAEQIGSEILSQFGKQVPANWRLISRVWGGPSNQHEFILQEAGEDTYHQLMGEYLAPPLWYLRWAGFDGEQEARAEEFHIYLQADGSLHNLTHHLPDSRPGAQLEEDDARALAEQAIVSAFERNPGELTPVHTQSTQHPDRVDWEFLYTDAERFPLAQGETRVQVRIGGDQIAMVNRYVHVPDEWSRAQRDSRSWPNIIQVTSNLMLIVVLLSAAVVAIVRWSSGRFHLRVFLYLGIVAFTLAGISFGLSWPEVAVQFDTALPYSAQFWIALGTSILVLGTMTGALAVIAGLLHSIRLPLSNRTLTPAATVAYSLSLAFAILGLRSLFQLLQSSPVPHWGSLGPLSSHLPFLQAAVGIVEPVIIQSLFLLVVFAAAHHLSAGWQRRRPLVLILLMLIGYFTAGTHVPNVTSWLVMGTAFGVLLCAAWVWVLRHHLALVIPMVTATVVLDNIGNLTSPMYSGALPGYLLGSLLAVALATLWYQALCDSNERSVSVESAREGVNERAIGNLGDAPV